MPKVIDTVDNVREKAVEVGVYLPLGAYAKVRDEISDLDSRRIKRFYGTLVRRGQNRAEPIEKMIRRRGRQIERKADEIGSDARSTARRAQRRAEGTAEDVGRKTKQTTRKAAARAEAGADAVAPKMPRVAAPKSARELPIQGYDELTVDEILAATPGLTQTDLAKIYKYERANEGRTTILEPLDGKFIELPIPTYDALTVGEISERLDGLSESELKMLQRYEKNTKARATVLDKLESRLS